MMAIPAPLTFSSTISRPPFGVWNTTSIANSRLSRLPVCHTWTGSNAFSNPARSRCRDAINRTTECYSRSVTLKPDFRRIMKTLLTALLLLATLAVPASAKTEFGKLGAAEFRIDVPANWNHGLVLYCHGYDPHSVGVGYDPKKPLPPELAV